MEIKEYPCFNLECVMVAVPWLGCEFLPGGYEQGSMMFKGQGGFRPDLCGQGYGR